MEKTTNDPLWEVLDHQGRSITWLANATGRSQWYLFDVKKGKRATDKAFREECAKVLGVPEQMLFLSPDVSVRANGVKRRSSQRKAEVA